MRQQRTRKTPQFNRLATFAKCKKALKISMILLIALLANLQVIAAILAKLLTIKELIIKLFS